MKSRLMKDMILEEKHRGKTILLTTHNMQDATELCDRVAFGAFVITAALLPVFRLSPLSALLILGAVVPYFIPKPVCYCLSILPSFWIGKAVLENALIWMLPAVFVAGIWIFVLAIGTFLLPRP